MYITLETTSTPISIIIIQVAITVITGFIITNYFAPSFQSNQKTLD